jgi:hypothetical protein
MVLYPEQCVERRGRDEPESCRVHGLEVVRRGVAPLITLSLEIALNENAPTESSVGAFFGIGKVYSN